MGCSARTRLRSLGLVGGLVVISLPLLPSSAALAATRYAAPGASGNCSSEAEACQLKTAMEGANASDTVVLLGDRGSYGTAEAPLSEAIGSPKPGEPAVLEGAPGQPRPVIYTSAAVGIDFAEESSTPGEEQATALSGVEVRELAANHVAVESAGSIDHVIARASGDSVACRPVGLEAGTHVLVDSLCVGEGEASKAMYITAPAGGHTQIELRNDTLYAGGPRSRGLEVLSEGRTTNVSATNVIIHGQGEDLDSPEGRVNLTFSHCDFAVSSLSKEATEVESPTGSDQRGPALFVNAGAGDFEEAQGSPTIDAGVTEAADGETDLAGRPRVIGSSTDIGAYEAMDAPSIATPAVTGITSTSATVQVSVNPGYAATSVQAFLGTGAAAQSLLATQAVGALTSAQLLSFPLGSLSPGTTYHVHLTATNSAGSAAGAEVTFTTSSAAALAGAGAGTGTATAPGNTSILTSSATLEGHSVAVLIACSAPSTGCRGELVLAERVRGRVKERVHDHFRLHYVTVVVTLGRASFRLAAGARETVLVALSRSVRASLAHAPHHRLKAIATSTPVGAGAVETVRLTIAAPARPRRDRPRGRSSSATGAFSGHAADRLVAASS